MPSLIIDTSSNHCLLALSKGEKILSTLSFPHENELSQTLIPTLQKLLEEKETPLSSLQKIYAGMGPGSYTGTRVGVSVAKALSFSLKIPFRGFCSLLAFLPEKTGTFSLILPSKLGQYYLCKGSKDPNGVFLKNAALLSKEALLEKVEPSDLIGCNTHEQLPIELQELSPLPLSPNFIALNQFLLLEVGLLDEQSELIYLHTP